VGVILQQRDFVSMVSHELRSLLALVDANAQRFVTLRERLTAPEVAERALRIRDAVRRMTGLIDNLVAPSRLLDIHGNVHFHEEPVNVTALLCQACQLQRDLTPDALIVETGESQPLLVRGDEVLLRQVFGNILDNAVKYSPLHAGVEVVVTATENEVIVVIEDRGIGIPDDALSHVFEHSFRASNTRAVSGSGLGLYVAKTVVDLHQGSIGVASREGSGSRFEVVLPRRS
jgi:two-component system OmpR family sensor kinase